MLVANSDNSFSTSSSYSVSSKPLHQCTASNSSSNLAPPFLRANSQSQPHYGEDFPAPVPTPVREVTVQPAPQPQFDFALEGRSISLQRRAQVLTPQAEAQVTQRKSFGEKTFCPLQLKIDLHSEQGVDVPSRVQSAVPSGTGASTARQARRLRAQIKRRQEQQKPSEEVVYQRRTPTRPKTSTAYRTPLAMSTMSMPAAGQKFNVADDALVFNTAEEASAVVKRLLAKSTNVLEEHQHHVTSTSSTNKVSQVTENLSGFASPDYLQDSFDFLHQRHIKNLSDVIARHQRGQQQQQQQQAPSQQQQHGEAQPQPQEARQAQPLSQSYDNQQTGHVKQRKQVHIHQSNFYDGQLQNGLEHHDGDMNGDARTNSLSKNSSAQTFTSSKSINLSYNNSGSTVSDMEKQQRRCVRDRASSTSSVQSTQSTRSDSRSDCSDNCNNNNLCCKNDNAEGMVCVNNKTNSKSEVQKSSSKSSTSSITSSTSSTTKVQQSFSSSSSTKKQVFKQSFSSSSQDFEDRIGIDVMLTPNASVSAMMLKNADDALDSRMVSSGNRISSGKSKVKETSKVTTSSSVFSASSDNPEGECKQSAKSVTSKTVKKSVSDGKKVKTDVEQFCETAEEEAEGTPDKPVITFSHVSAEGSAQHFEKDIVRFDSSALSSPSRSRSPSPLLEMPAPYDDLSKEIKRPPAPSIQKA